MQFYFDEVVTTNNMSVFKQIKSLNSHFLLNQTFCVHFAALNSARQPF